MPYVKTIEYDHRLLSYLNGAPTLYGPIRTGYRVGTAVKDWRKLIKNGYNATSDYSSSQYRYEDNVMIAAQCAGYYYHLPTLRVSGNYQGYPGGNQTFMTLALSPDNLALSKLYTKIRDKRSEMNGSLFLGEFAETVRMLRSPANSLVKGFVNWSGDVSRRIGKRPSAYRGIRNRRKLVDMLSGTYLEAMFGWKPFISDLKDLAATAERIYQNHDRRVDRVFAICSTSGNYCESIVTGDPAEVGSQISASNWDKRFTHDSSVRYEAFLSSSLTGDISSFSDVARVSGLTFENLVPTMYNLVPYSFLIDYASNLGKCIEARFTDVSTVKFAVKTNRDRYTNLTLVTPSAEAVRVWLNSLGIYMDHYSSSDAGKVKEVWTTLTRQNLPSLPMPVLEFNLPNSGTKIGNMVALLASNLKTFRF